MSDNHDDYPARGRCVCGEVQYELQRAPMFVHCCHCTWCQRETGSAFVLNAMVESDAVRVTAGAPERYQRPSNSGYGQEVLQCPNCRVALWSHFAGKQQVAFLRTGTLENSALCPPDIHVYTTTKLPWVILPEGVPAVPEFYRRSEYWPEDSYLRYKQATGG